MNAAGTAPATPVSWDYTFQGGRQDSVTGRVSFGARDYIPFEGKWAQRDPLGLGAGDPNIYEFADSNPTTYSDPTGLYIGKEDGRGSGGTPASGKKSGSGYGDKWYNDGPGDWFNPAAYLAQWGSDYGDRIGAGYGTAFYKDNGPDDAMDAMAQNRQMADFAADPLNAPIPSMRSLQSRAMERDLNDLGVMADGALAAAELTSDVAGIVSAGLALKRIGGWRGRETEGKLLRRRDADPDGIRLQADRAGRARRYGALTR
jgi:RHS repeat-associated protein